MAEMDTDSTFQDDRLILSPEDFSYPDSYAGDGGYALRRNDAIAYDYNLCGAIDEPVLFFGPYIQLDDGVYLFRFNGDLRGSLRIRFTHQCGIPIREVTIENFREPLCLVLRQQATDFEVVAEKTPSLRSLQIGSIIIDRIRLDRHTGTEGAGKISALSPAT